MEMSKLTNSAWYPITFFRPTVYFLMNSSLSLSGGVPATRALLQCSGEEGADGGEDEEHQRDEVSGCHL